VGDTGPKAVRVAKSWRFDVEVRVLSCVSRENRIDPGRIDHRFDITLDDYHVVTAVEMNHSAWAALDVAGLD
jgi:hypothetical protein